VIENKANGQKFLFTGIMGRGFLGWNGESDLMQTAERRYSRLKAAVAARSSGHR
jgi:hypothetical protein